MEAIINDFYIQIKSVGAQGVKSIEIDLDQQHLHEVIGGLFARQITLMLDFILSPNSWSINSAPLILRSMADVHITLSWILIEPHERCKEYIQYGLGQAKLHMEHRKRINEEKGLDPQDDDRIRFYEAWISRHKYPFMVDVNLGHWAGSNTRKMADEANLLELYNGLYSPFSGCVHSTWDFVGTWNILPSDSSLHGHTLIPTIFERPMSFSMVFEAIDILELSIHQIEKYTQTTLPNKSLRENLMEELEKLEDESDGEL